MCIRDRNGNFPIGFLVWKTSQNPKEIITEVSIEVFDKTVNCLLYTSDAADERSSVDLGGRRIIKKKNHRE